MKIAYLGPEGSYSHLAANAFLQDEVKGELGLSECIPFRNFSEVLEAVSMKRVDAAALPIENSLQGGVLQALDLLQNTSGLYAVKEKIVKIDHRLIYKEGVKLSQIGRIYSHRQALDQCATFLRKECSFASLREVESTGFGVAKAFEDETGKSAAIAGAHTTHLQKGFVMSERCIADEENNFTHFLLIKKGEDCLPKASGKIFFSTVCEHKPGSLLALLEIIKQFGVNMTKIESRPVKNVYGEYRFFIEAECDISTKEVKDMLEKIRRSTIEYKLIGVYR